MMYNSKNSTEYTNKMSHGNTAWEGGYEHSHAPRGAPRGRSFPRGRGGRARKTQPSPPPPSPKMEVPKAKYLSKTASKETNDPLFKEAWFPDPGTELAPEAKELEVYPSCESLPVIIDVLYTEAVASKQSFSKRVCHSAFAYYCATLAYGRLLTISSANQDELSYRETQFIKQVEQGHYIVPTLLSTYLSGFGNTTIPSGRDVKFKMKKPDEFLTAVALPGWFGRVDNQTHFLYKHYPCLAVYAYRILCDIAAPVEDEEPGEEEDIPDERWDLPQDVRCQAQGCGRPTENLLGWRRSERLSHEKRTFLELSGIYEGEFPVNNRAISFSNTLMHAVSTELKEIDRLNFSEVSAIPLGSQGQLVFDIFSRAEPIVEIRQETYSNSLTGPLGPTSFIGGSFVYRTKHAIDRGRKVWSVYDFGRFAHVPQNWTDTINALRVDEPDDINFARFRTRPFYVLNRVKDFSSKEINIK